MLAIAENPHYHKRTKHFDIKHHFIRDQIKNEIIQVKYCPTGSDVRARAWPKAQAWARLEWAQACKNPEPGSKPKLGLGWARLGLEPGLFAYHGIMNKYDK
jgi:hypothetical protein